MEQWNMKANSTFSTFSTHLSGAEPSTTITVASCYIPEHSLTKTQPSVCKNGVAKKFNRTWTSFLYLPRLDHRRVFHKELTKIYRIQNLDNPTHVVCSWFS